MGCRYEDGNVVWTTILAMLDDGDTIMPGGDFDLPDRPADTREEPQTTRANKQSVYLGLEGA